MVPINRMRKKKLKTSYQQTFRCSEAVYGKGLEVLYMMKKDKHYLEYLEKKNFQ
jgi:hypothetical protein